MAVVVVLIVWLFHYLMQNSSHHLTNQYQGAITKTERGEKKKEEAQNHQARNSKNQLQLVLYYSTWQPLPPPVKIHQSSNKSENSTSTYTDTTG